MKSQYDQLLTSVLKELENKKEELSRTQQELSAQKEQVLTQFAASNYFSLYSGLKNRIFLHQTASVQTELLAQREQTVRLQDEAAVVRRSCEDKCSELTSFLNKYQEKSRELDEVRMKLQAERLSSRWRMSSMRPLGAAAVKTKLVQQQTQRLLQARGERGEEGGF